MIGAIFRFFGAQSASSQENYRHTGSEAGATKNTVLSYNNNPKNRACLVVRNLRTATELNKVLHNEPALLNSYDTEGYNILDRIFALDENKHRKLIDEYLLCVLKKNINPDLARGSNYNKGIHSAVMKNNAIAVKRVLWRFPELLHHNIENGGTVAHLAARFAKKEVMLEILGLFALYYQYKQPLDNDEEGRSPLHLATLEGRIDIVKELMIRGASPHTKDSGGNTPINYAEKYDHKEIFNLLMTYKKHFSKIPKYSLNPL